ncbi:plasmid replication protein [Azospirillum sp. TSO35-2]|uniref:plasmid replication protein n=1 Tax=Azospirillum sp. TSO35-2 TaxID=716796 RepID=UPI000D61ADCE|nr:plasmid replication protein [Azospirillum sp. TSO35-2]PWC35935.1 plasmid replication protein [Azospirillum sp. TSO35-2]
MSKVATSAAQLVLFELEDRKQSHLIALYDLAPRFIFAQQREDAEKGSVKSVYREFSFRGQTFYLSLQPARMAYERTGEGRGRFVPAPTPEQARNLAEVEVFPAEREQIVEQVVRRLAMDRARLSLAGENQDQVRLDFSLYDIGRELRNTNHSLNYSEIRESLTILARARIIISKASASERKRGSDLLDSTAFPVLVVRRPDGAQDEDGGDQTYVQFNPLVATAIRGLEFRPVSYEWLMRLKNPVSRWLYNRLSVEFETPDDEADAGRVMTISADEIIKNSGMTEYSRRRDTLRVVTAAVDALVDEGILDGRDLLHAKTGKRIDGIDYVLRPSRRFLDQVRRAEQVADVNAAVVKAVTGSEERPNAFVPLTPMQALETRKARATRLAASQGALPLLDGNG